MNRFLLTSFLFAGLVVVSCGGSSTTNGGPDATTDGGVLGDALGNPDVSGPPCTSDVQCSQPTPYCDTPANVCVQCLGDPNCNNGQNGNRFCNLGSHTCVQCNTSAQCGGQNPYCSAGGSCVQCLAGGNCGQNQKCNLTTFQCVTGCTTDPQCSQPTAYCDTILGYCVECLSNTNCANPQRPICDTSTNTCVQCQIDTDCKNPQQPRCNVGNNQCVECLVNLDCGDAGICQMNHTCQ